MAEIFVFGSNLLGIHGKGAALYARTHHGDEMGKGVGEMGTCYAIPTKDTPNRTLPLLVIHRYIDDFLRWAEQCKDNTYMLTPIGCGYAGYHIYQIAALFDTGVLLDNLRYPKEFIEFIPALQSRPDLIANFPNYP